MGKQLLVYRWWYLCTLFIVLCSGIVYLSIESRDFPWELNHDPILCIPKFSQSHCCIIYWCCISLFIGSDILYGNWNKISLHGISPLTLACFPFFFCRVGCRIFRVLHCLLNQTLGCRVLECYIVYCTKH